MTQVDFFDPADSMAVRFAAYHARNPEVYDEFCKIALEAIRRGHKHFGANGVIEVLRWQTPVTGDDGFKINNNYAPYYARRFEADFPQFDGFFRKRGLRA